LAIGRQRIAWVIYGSLEQVSGGYIYDRLVVEHLRELGDDVTVVSLTAGSDELPSLTNADFDSVIGDELCFSELGPLFRDRSPGLRRVLLIHHLSAWEHPEGMERARLLGLEKAAIDAADACVATSLATADRLRSERLVRDVFVAEPGADRLQRPASAGQEPSGAHVRLLFIGNILPRKRVLELVNAFAGLPSAHAELVLVGAELDPGYAAEVRLAIASSEVAPRVRLMGCLEASQVMEQLAMADALVLPSSLEGYGMVLSEALWSGVPVIAARVGAAEQLLSQSRAGLLFDPQDEAGLYSALSRFVSDPALRKRLRESARSAQASLPRWRDTAQALRATLQA